MRCLIIDEIHPQLIQLLEKEGTAVEYAPESDRTEVEKRFGTFEILVIRSKFLIDSIFLKACNGLKIIGRAGAGLDNIDIETAENLGIQVLHAAEGNADAVGEHTIGLILMALNKINEAGESVKAGNWLRETYRGAELKCKTVGLLGYGNMGRAVSQRLRSFGCRVIAYDKYLENWPDENAVRVDLEQLQLQSDIFSIHLPLTSETDGWINSGFLSQLKKGVILINTARGPIVPVAGLLAALKQNQVQFAGLDVLENEPPVEKGKKISPIYQELFSLKNVLITPHIAGWSLESYEKISIVLANKIIAQTRILKNKIR